MLNNKMLASITFILQFKIMQCLESLLKHCVLFYHICVKRLIETL